MSPTRPVVIAAQAPLPPPPIAPSAPVTWLLRAAHWWRVAQRFLVVSSLAAAMYQFVLIDPGLIGFAVVWTWPPILVVALDLFVPMRRFPRTVVFLYLLLVAWGSWLGKHPAFMPGLGGLHPGQTEFAAKWNQLDVASRRLIAWNMGLSGSLLFWTIGYALGWLPLTLRRRGVRTDISSATSVLVLVVVWGIFLLTLPILLLTLFGCL